MEHILRAEGYLIGICLDARGHKVWSEGVKNGVTTPGATDLLTQGFAAGTQRTAWYFGLIDNTSYSAISTDDTLASHAGWTELTSYTEATRVAWTGLSVSGGVITNATLATFTFSAQATLRGMFLASNSTKSGTTGILWSSGLLSVARIIYPGQTYNLKYVLRLKGGGT